MALSDSLDQLAAQAKSVETSAAAVEAEDGAAVTARLESLEASIESAKNAFGDELVAAGDQTEADWAASRKSVSDAFASLHRKAADRHAQHRARRAGREADFAEADAADAVDFAIYAIQEAEYAVLQAAVARKDADELGAS